MTEQWGWWCPEHECSSDQEFDSREAAVANAQIYTNENSEELTFEIGLCRFPNPVDYIFPAEILESMNEAAEDDGFTFDDSPFEASDEFVPRLEEFIQRHITTQSWMIADDAETVTLRRAGTVGGKE